MNLRNITAAFGTLLVGASAASGATLFHQLESFESGVPAAFAPQNGAILTQESLGTTNGAFSLGVEFTDTRPGEGGPQDHVYVAIDATNDNYAKWQEAATLQATTNRRFAVAYDMFLDFDGTTLPPGATLFGSDFRYNQTDDPAATPPIPGFQSIGGEFSLPTRYSTIPTIDQSINIVVPFGTGNNLRSFVANPSPDVGFYQLQLGHKYDPVGLGGAAKVYYDNFRILEFEQPQEQVLFSWETPNDPGTAENEQLEGWGPGASVTPEAPLANHSRSITAVGATDGGSALQIGTPNGIAAPGFTWGSQVTYTQQAQVDSVASALDDGERIELDVTFTESGNGTASFFSFFMHISDSRGNFFQSPAAQFDGIANLELGEERTMKIQFGLREFKSGLALLTDADLLGTTSLSIGIGTNEGSIMPVTFSVDKLRIFSEGGSVVETGDFNDDGTVNGADFLAWQRGFGTPDASLAQGDGNGDGLVNAADLAIWKAQFGTAGTVASVGAVPEPASALLAGLGVVAANLWRRRSR